MFLILWKIQFCRFQIEIVEDGGIVDYNEATGKYEAKRGLRVFAHNLSDDMRYYNWREGVCINTFERPLGNVIEIGFGDRIMADGYPKDRKKCAFENVIRSYYQ